MVREERLYSAFGNNAVLFVVACLARLFLGQTVFNIFDELLVLVITLNEGSVPSYSHFHVLIRC